MALLQEDEGSILEGNMSHNRALMPFARSNPRGWTIWWASKETRVSPLSASQRSTENSQRTAEV